MTPAQETAIRQIQEIAREHFDASVIVLSGTPSDPEQEDRACDVQYLYSGGFATTVGLMTLAQRHIMDSGRDKNSLP